MFLLEEKSFDYLVRFVLFNIILINFINKEIDL